MSVARIISHSLSDICNVFNHLHESWRSRKFVNFVIISWWRRQLANRIVIDVKLPATTTLFAMSNLFVAIKNHLFSNHDNAVVLFFVWKSTSIMTSYLAFSTERITSTMPSRFRIWLALLIRNLLLWHRLRLVRIVTFVQSLIEILGKRRWCSILLIGWKMSFLVWRLRVLVY